jgi:transcriptional regulator with GAF, ATPase, and Fis domain
MLTPIISDNCKDLGGGLFRLMKVYFKLRGARIRRPTALAKPGLLRSSLRLRRPDCQLGLRWALLHGILAAPEAASKPTMVALFGRYEYERELGRGATGRVFAVRDLAEGGAARAIKVVGAAHASLLVWEFRRLCRLDHPRIARVRELLRIDAPVHAPFRLAAPALLLVEDRAAGAPLSTLSAPSDRRAREVFALRVALSAAEGLRAIHGAGLVHGDVKPDNLLVVEGSGESTLIDLGFCAPPGPRAEVRGTPRYMAPELFSGLCSAAADVYALGATLFDWLTGEADGHSSSRGGELLHVRNLGLLRELVTPAFADVIGALLAADPAQRPGDADGLYALLVPVAQSFSLLSRKDPALLDSGPSGEALAARARTLPFVGHAAALARVAEELDAHGTVLVSGAHGAGRSRLVREAVRRVSLAALESGRPGPTLVRSVAGLSGLPETPAILWLDPASHAAAREIDSALRIKGLRSASLAIVVECEPTFIHGSVARVELGPLEAEAFTSLLTRLIEPHPLSPALREAASQASQNFAGRLCNVLAEACAERRDLSDPRSLRARTELDTGSLSAAAFALASFSAWTGGVFSETVLAHAPLGERERETAFAELWARGFLLGSSGVIELVPSVATDLRARSFAARGESLASVPADAPLESGFAFFARGQLHASEQAFHAEAGKLRRQGEVERACLLLREAAGMLPAEALRVSWADAERAQAHYQDALLALEDTKEPEARLLAADILRLRGERDAAAQMVSELARSVDPALRARAGAIAARVAFDTGDLSLARDLAEAAAHAAAPEARVRAREVLLLIALATGLPDYDQADALSEAAAALASPRYQARALLLRAQLAARRGEPERAMADALRALDQAEQAGESHEAASAALNLGLLQAEAGELGLALSTLGTAAFRLARIDRPSDLSRVLFNLSALSLVIGDHVRAEALLDAAEEPASHAADPAVRAFLAMTRAELCLKNGAIERAASLLQQALDALPEGLRPIRAVLYARVAQTALVRGDTARARSFVAEARASCEAADVSVELEVVVAEIRERLSSGASARAEELALSAMPLIAARAPFAERLRFLLAAIDAARAADQEGKARERILLCRALLEAALGSLPPSARGKLRERPEYTRILAAPMHASESVGARGADRWRKLVASARRLFAKRQRRELAEEMVEIALSLVHAERAFLIACLEDGALELRAKAELGPSGAQEPVYSRSVVARVWSERRPLLTLEASRDLRLHGAQSIHALSVRSVLAVPVSGFGEPAVLYLDDRLRADAFNSDDLALLEDLAALTREALRAAQARQVEQRRARKAEEEASALTRALLIEGELGQDKTSPMIGVSPALQSVTASARRVARSDVSLLITGESGTGKELLARLVHQESVRRAQPFVAENCAALPDTLLESALFGHVRGAFTGADRARRGLFEAADQGTLFLDEVGEMSPALQAKLLRVLQEGEFRPLGSERTRKVDVRVIAATRRDLAARVREGNFREDLYYRLAVVTLELPPLSARRDDIPLLVRHFLGKHQGEGRNVIVTAAAMRAFVDGSYPGNIRQLENEVRRALALCEGPKIDVVDLPGGAVQPPASEPGPAALDLHAQLEALSFRLVDEAMERSTGNVTQAAELLGISRFGLQKMLKRRKRD